MADYIGATPQNPLLGLLYGGYDYLRSPQRTQQMQGRVDDIVEFSGLGDRIRHPLYTYSSGMRARLAFSIATSVEPEILLVDEGIGAADEEFSERAALRLNVFLKNAGILLLASHSNQLIESWCTKKVRMETGLLVPAMHRGKH